MDTNITEQAVRASNVDLIHGAYADGSCWFEVIDRLQRFGLNVMSVQNPLTSLADDVATTQRARSAEWTDGSRRPLLGRHRHQRSRR